MTRLRAGRSEVGIPVWARDFPLFPKRPDWSWGPPPPPSYSIVTEILAPMAKRRGVQLNYPPLSSAQVNAWSYATTPVYTDMAWKKENCTITVTFTFYMMMMMMLMLMLVLEPGSSPYRPNDASAQHSARCFGSPGWLYLVRHSPFTSIGRYTPETFSFKCINHVFITFTNCPSFTAIQQGMSYWYFIQCNVDSETLVIFWVQDSICWLPAICDEFQYSNCYW